MISSILIYAITIISSILSFGLYYLNGRLIRKSKILNFISIIGIFMLPCILSYIRYGIGTDYFTYEIIYKNINAYSLWSYLKAFNQNDATIYEIFFYLINRIAFYINNNFKLVLFLCTLITMLFTFLALKNYKTTCNIVLGWFIFMCMFYQQTFNNLRQTIAVMVVLYSFQYLLKKNFIKYIICILIATLFHRSACICIVFYIFCSENKRFNNIMWLTLFWGIVAMPILFPIFFSVGRYIPLLKHFFNFYTFINTPHIGLGFLIYIIPPLLPLLFFKNQIRDENNYYTILLQIFILSIPLKFSSYYSLWAGRFADYTLASQIILIPIFIASLKNKRNKMIICIYYILWYLFYYVYYYFMLNTGHTVPFIYR